MHTPSFRSNYAYGYWGSGRPVATLVVCCSSELQAKRLDFRKKDVLKRTKLKGLLKPYTFWLPVKCLLPFSSEVEIQVMNNVIPKYASEQYSMHDCIDSLLKFWGHTAT